MSGAQPLPEQPDTDDEGKMKNRLQILAKGEGDIYSPKIFIITSFISTPSQTICYVDTASKKCVLPTSLQRARPRPGQRGRERALSVSTFPSRAAGREGGRAWGRPDGRVCLSTSQDQAARSINYLMMYYYRGANYWRPDPQ